MNKACMILLLLIVTALLSSPCHAQVQHSYGTLDQFNPWTAVNQFTVGLFTGPMTYSQITALVFVSPGTIITCSNCTTGSNPCTIGSSQVIAVYLNSVWNCGFGGSGGGSNPGIANQVAYYATSGSTVSGDSNLTDNATNLTYIPIGGIIASALSSPSSTAPMILRSPVPISACTPQVGYSLMTLSTDGNWYDSNNNGTCYQHQLIGSVSPIANDFIKYDSSFHTAPIVGVSSPSTGQINLGTASTITGALCFYISTGTGDVCLQPSGIYGTPNVTIAIPNFGTNTTLASTAGALTIGDCINVASTGALQDAGTGCNGNFPTNQSLGDTVRYSIYGDSKWDAAQSGIGISLGWYTDQVQGVADCYGAVGCSHPVASGAFGTVYASANHSAGGTYTSSSSASTSTVVGQDIGAGANFGDWGFGAFYRMTFSLSIGNTSSARYWIGMTVFSTSAGGCANVVPLGTTCFASNTPNTSALAFRYSAGTDTHWQAVSINAGTATVTNTGVSADTSVHLFEIAAAANVGYNYYIDGALVATITTNLPSTNASANAQTIVFWCGDNENTATAISGTSYWTSMSEK